MKKILIPISIVIAVIFFSRDIWQAIPESAKNHKEEWHREVLPSKSMSASFPAPTELKLIMPQRMNMNAEYAGGTIRGSWDGTQVDMRISEEPLPQAYGDKKIVLEALIYKVSKMGKVEENQDIDGYRFLKIRVTDPVRPDHYFIAKIKVSDFVQRAIAVYPCDYDDIATVEQFLSSVSFEKNQVPTSSNKSKKR